MTSYMTEDCDLEVPVCVLCVLAHTCIVSSPVKIKFQINNE